MARPLLTKEQLELFKQNNRGKTNKEMTEWTNDTFNLSLTEHQVMVLRANHHLVSGLTGYFEKGKASWNKGKHTATKEFLAHSYKKGESPNPRQRPVGSEKVCSDGFVKIKIAEPNVWKLKHYYVWENANGKVPEGKVILFLDGNKENCELTNLRLVDKKVQSTVAIRHLSSTDKNINKAGILLTELEFKISDKRGK